MKSSNYKKDEEIKLENFIEAHQDFRPGDLSILISNNSKQLFSEEVEVQYSTLNWFLSVIQTQNVMITPETFHRILDFSFSTDLTLQNKSLELIHLLLSYPSHMLDMSIAERIILLTRSIFPTDSSLRILSNFSLYGTWTQTLIYVNEFIPLLIEFGRNCSSETTFLYFTTLCNNILLPIPNINQHIQENLKEIIELFNIIYEHIYLIKEEKFQNIAFSFFENFIVSNEFLLEYFINNNFLKIFLGFDINDFNIINHIIIIGQEILEGSQNGIRYLFSIHFVEWISKYLENEMTMEKSFLFLSHMCFSYEDTTEIIFKESFYKLAASIVVNEDNKFRNKKAAFELLIEFSSKIDEISFLEFIGNGCFKILFEYADVFCETERYYLIRSISRIISFLNNEIVQETINEMRNNENFINWLTEGKFDKDLEASRLSRYVLESIFYCCNEEE